MRSIQIAEFGGRSDRLARPDLAIPMIGELLGAVAVGELEATIGGVYPLSEARRAHEDLISRRSSGKLLLDPSK